MNNMEIQVGEYVRTIRGIVKIKEIHTVQARMNGKDYITYKINKPYIGLSLEDIVNHDFNIIKLIEEGDYVNGHLVVGFNEKVDINGYKYKEIEIESDYLINHHLKLEDIKSIVTKEQFKSMEYILGGKDE